MRAARIHQFGPPEVIVVDEIPRPTPGDGEVLVRVAAAGVGPWDALIRERKSVVNVALPLILGSDLSGTIAQIGQNVSGFAVGDQIYGVTNPQFCGAYAEYALASSAMVARKPTKLTNIEAASVPVVAVTAWQMLFDYARATAGQTVLILGAAGNVGAYAVQFASQAQLHVIATASSADTAYVQSLGAHGFGLQNGAIRKRPGPGKHRARYGWRTNARSFHPIRQARWHPRFGRFAISGIAKAGRNPHRFLCENHDRAPEHTHRTLRSRQTLHPSRYGAASGAGAHCPRNARRSGASPAWQNRPANQRKRLGSIEAP